MGYAARKLVASGSDLAAFESSVMPKNNNNKTKIIIIPQMHFSMILNASASLLLISEFSGVLFISIIY